MSAKKTQRTKLTGLNFYHTFHFIFKSNVLSFPIWEHVFAFSEERRTKKMEKTTTIEIIGIEGMLDVLKSLILSGYTVTASRLAPAGVMVGSELADKYRLVAQK